MLRDALASIVPQLERSDEICVFDNQDVPGLNLTPLAAQCDVRVAVRDAVLPMQASWTASFRLASRPWVMWLHDDDVIRPGAVAALRAILREDVSLAWGAAALFRERVPDWHAPLTGGTVRYVEPSRSLAEYLFRMPHQCSGTVLARGKLEAFLPIPADAGLAADLWLFHHLASTGTTAVLEQTTVGWRQHADSESSRMGKYWKWRTSIQAQRASIAAMLRADGVPTELTAEVAKSVPVPFVIDSLRSLLRARSELFWPLAKELSSVPGVRTAPGWRGITRAARIGAWWLDVDAAARAVARSLTQRGAKSR